MHSRCLSRPGAWWFVQFGPGGKLIPVLSAGDLPPAPGKVDLLAVSSPGVLGVQSPGAFAA